MVWWKRQECSDKEKGVLQMKLCYFATFLLPIGKKTTLFSSIAASPLTLRRVAAFTSQECSNSRCAGVEREDPRERAEES